MCVCVCEYDLYHTNEHIEHKPNFVQQNTHSAVLRTRELFYRPFDLCPCIFVIFIFILIFFLYFHLLMISFHSAFCSTTEYFVNRIVCLMVLVNIFFFECSQANNHIYEWHSLALACKYY